MLVLDKFTANEVAKDFSGVVTWSMKRKIMNFLFERKVFQHGSVFKTLQVTVVRFATCWVGGTRCVLLAGDFFL